MSGIFPKYYLLKVNNFNKVAENSLDEWIYFLKNSEVKDGFSAKGLDRAKEKLRYEELSDEDKKIYDRFQENKRIEQSVTYTAEIEAKYIRSIEIANNAILEGFDDDIIIKLTGLTKEQIQTLRN